MEHTIFNILVQNPQAEALLTIIYLVEALFFFFVSVNVWKEDYHPNSFSVIRWKKKIETARRQIQEEDLAKVILECKELGSLETTEASRGQVQARGSVWVPRLANKIGDWGWGPCGSMFCSVGTLMVGKSLLQTRGARVWEVSRGLLRTRFLAAAQSFWLSRPGWHLTGASLTGSRSCDAAGPGHRTTVSLDCGLGILSLGEKTKLQGLFES